MNRRSFLSGLFGVAATAVVAPAIIFDPELLLWKPGAKTIFIPSAAIPPEFSSTFATGSATFVAGDVITINGRYARHPRTRKLTGFLQQFVVTDNDGHGIITLSPGR